MVTKKPNIITLASVVISGFTFVAPNLNNLKYSWWLILFFCLIFIFVFGYHIGTIIYVHYSSMDKFKSMIGRVKLLLSIYFFISVAGFICYKIFF
ncbi:amino acid permease [Pantoea ananatis]|nr:amino acid permease [Pantoea ananatis]MDR6088850.1 amino acid permease [Pantoea ananatis]